jgi:hypothetical protein
MYIGVEHPRGLDVASRFAMQILVLHNARRSGAPLRVTIRSTNGVWIVASDFDWTLGESPALVASRFDVMSPFVEDGPNSVRAEILVRAFAQEFSVFRRGELITESAVEAASAMECEIPQDESAIAFVMPVPY